MENMKLVKYRKKDIIIRIIISVIMIALIILNFIFIEKSSIYFPLFLIPTFLYTFFSDYIARRMIISNQDENLIIPSYYAGSYFKKKGSFIFFTVLQVAFLLFLLLSFVFKIFN